MVDIADELFRLKNRYDKEIDVDFIELVIILAKEVNNLQTKVNQLEVNNHRLQVKHMRF